MTTEAKTCGGCAHWLELGLNPQDLGAGRQGECRESVHAVGVPRAAGGRVELGVVATYVTVPAGFPACSRHVPRAKVVTA